jgi:hypothetical protein
VGLDNVRTLQDARTRATSRDAIASVCGVNKEAGETTSGVAPSNGVDVVFSVLSSMTFKSKRPMKCSRVL